VFAVEDTSARVCWRGLPEGSVLEAARAEVGPGGPTEGVGAVTLEHPPPDMSLDLTLDAPGAGGWQLVAAFATLAPPPGRLLCRFATVRRHPNRRAGLRAAPDPQATGRHASTRFSSCWLGQDAGRRPGQLDRFGDEILALVEAAPFAVKSATPCAEEM